MRISTDVLVNGVAAVANLNGVDSARLSGEEAAEWITRVARVRHAADAILAGLAQRIDELSTGAAGGERFDRAKGFASAADLVARVGDLAPGEAGKLVGLGRALATGQREGPPQAGSLAAAVGAGAIGMDKANIIRRCLTELPDPDAELERALVRAARHLDLSALRALCLRELARRDNTALEERERRQCAARALRFFHEADGMVTMHGKLDAQTAAPVRAWIDAEVRRALNDQRGLVADEQRTPAQAAADALAAMARHMLGCEDPAAGTKTTLVVRVSKDALESRLGLAECDGLEAPVSVAALRAMAVDAEVVPAVMGGDSLPLDVGRARRLFTRTQRLALAERDGGCAKCGAPVARCDVHHIRWWSHGGRSDLDNGVLLCVGCHHRLHDCGWGIEVRDGVVWFIPPATVDPHRTPQQARRSHAEEERHLERSARLVAA